tara:strand:- start:906 stop:1109 length:204 start_codon:yes stop_codon:yes gene_type:complete
MDKPKKPLEEDLIYLLRIVEIERKARKEIEDIERELGQMKGECIVTDIHEAVYEAKEIVLKRLTYDD